MEKNTVERWMSLFDRPDLSFGDVAAAAYALQLANHHGVVGLRLDGTWEDAVSIRVEVPGSTVVFTPPTDCKSMLRSAAATLCAVFASACGRRLNPYGDTASFVDERVKFDLTFSNKLGEVEILVRAGEVT